MLRKPNSISEKENYTFPWKNRSSKAKNDSENDETQKKKKKKKKNHVIYTKISLQKFISGCKHQIPAFLIQPQVLNHSNIQCLNLPLDHYHKFQNSIKYRHVFPSLSTSNQKKLPQVYVSKVISKGETSTLPN